jgi:hypothetical protein
MKIILHLAVASAIAIAISGAARSAAAEGIPLTICNRVSVTLKVAIGYHTAGPNDPVDHSLLLGPFVSDGWYDVAPGQCVNFPNPHSARYMYWFGMTTKPWFTDNKVHGMYNYGAALMKSQDENAPGQHFCISTFFPFAYPPVYKFTYEDQNASIGACKTPVPGHDTNLWVKTREVDLTIHSEVDFTGEAPDYPDN